jgi:hypothetical protein
MSAIWELANWTLQFGIRQTGNRQFGMLPPSQRFHIVNTFQFDLCVYIIIIIIYMYNSN